MSIKTITHEDLQGLARLQGLSIVSVLDPVDISEHGSHLEEWQQQGFAGEMQFMTRSADLLCQPRRLLPGLVSAVVIGVHYDRTSRTPLPMGHGRIARYAWGRDYHKVLRKRLRALVESVESHVGSKVDARVFSDSVPLLERALAEKAGLGFIGKNTMLIVPRLGSFLFLAEVLWNVRVDKLRFPLVHSKSHCGSCSSCMTNCPTEAFVGERTLDARRCISYLTIEKRTALTEEERRGIGDWVFGCDVCQDVCPFNTQSIRKQRRSDIDEFSCASGAGQSLALSEVLSLRTHEAFVARFGGTAIMRAKREGLLRNAAIVAGNTLCASLYDVLTGVVGEDESQLIRQHALWATSRIAESEGTALLERFKRLAHDCLRGDPARSVRAEASSLLERLS